jgi:hypothetical protein
MMSLTEYGGFKRAIENKEVDDTWMSGMTIMHDAPETAQTIMGAYAQMRGLPLTVRYAKGGTYKASKAATLKTVLDMIQEKNSKIKFRTNTGNVAVAYTPESFIQVSCSHDEVNKHFVVTIIGFDTPELKKFADECFEHFDPAVVSGSVYMAISDGKNVNFAPVGVAGIELTKSNYPDEVLSQYDRICEELVAKVPRGRLTVVNGPPGTGKSFFIKGLISGCKNAAFVIIQPSDIHGIVSPSGLKMLMDFKDNYLALSEKVVLVMEDADDALAPREHGNMGMISALLNLGDGIMGSVLDIRIVATTNRETQEFDSAIMRPGRLSTHTTIGKLSPERAAARLTELLGEKVAPDKPMSLAEIYQRAYDKNWAEAKQQKPKTVGFGK